MNTLSERIKARRKDLKMTQGDVAKRIGISRVSYTQWELGETNPNGENLLKVAQVLSCTPDWIVSGKGSLNDIHENVEAAPRLKGLVPVINEVHEHTPLARGTYPTTPLLPSLAPIIKN